MGSLTGDAGTEATHEAEGAKTRGADASSIEFAHEPDPFNVEQRELLYCNSFKSYSTGEMCPLVTIKLQWGCNFIVTIK